MLLTERHLFGIYAFISRALVFSIPTLVIAFNHKEIYCGNITKIYGVLNLGLAEWLMWLATIDLITSYLAIFAILSRNSMAIVVLSRFFDSFTLTFKIGMTIGGLALIGFSTESCFSEAFILWIVSFIALVSLVGDLIIAFIGRLTY